MRGVCILGRQEEVDGSWKERLKAVRLVNEYFLVTERELGVTIAVFSNYGLGPISAL